MPYPLFCLVMGVCFILFYRQEMNKYETGYYDR